MRAQNQPAPAPWPDRIAAQGAGALRPHLLQHAPVPPLAPRRGDRDLDRPIAPAAAGTLTPAAVLLPIVARAEPTVLFTRRTPHLARHAGQVSFPGGRVQAGDPSLVETALRETREETGIAAEHVAVAGFLEPYETGTGFAVVPVVGLVREGFALVPNADEVEEVFEVPLGFLLDPANRARKAMERGGVVREFYVYDYGRHHIWGATAAILVDFSERLRGP